MLKADSFIDNLWGILFCFFELSSFIIIILKNLYSFVFNISLWHDMSLNEMCCFWSKNMRTNHHRKFQLKTYAWVHMNFSKCIAWEYKLCSDFIKRYKLSGIQYHKDQISDGWSFIWSRLVNWIFCTCIASCIRHVVNVYSTWQTNIFEIVV